LAVQHSQEPSDEDLALLDPVQRRITWRAIDSMRGGDLREFLDVAYGMEDNYPGAAIVVRGGVPWAHAEEADGTSHDVPVRLPGPPAKAMRGTTFGMSVAIGYARSADEALRKASAYCQNPAPGYRPPAFYVEPDGTPVVAGIRMRAVTAPDDMPGRTTRVALRFNRPLSDAEAEHAASLAEYAWRSSLHKAPFGQARQTDDRTLVFACDSDQSSHPASDFASTLPGLMTQGSPVRTTDRSGPGTKGTRALDGLPGASFDLLAA